VRQIPPVGFTASYERYADLPPFVLPCVEGLLHVLDEVPADQRFRSVYDRDVDEAVRQYCRRFQRISLRMRTVSSGGSSRALQPDDVRLEVKVETALESGTPGRETIFVQEKLRDSVRTTEQGPWPPSPCGRGALSVTALDQMTGEPAVAQSGGGGGGSGGG